MKIRNRKSTAKQLGKKCLPFGITKAYDTINWINNYTVN